MSGLKLLINRRLYEFGAFRLDTVNGLFVGEELVNLAPKVLKTLTLLVENPGRVISKDEFFEEVWADTFVEDNALSFNISQLRKTLSRFDEGTNFVETIPKRGFRFVGDVREISAETSETEIFINRHRIEEVVLEETSEDVTTHSALASKPIRSKIFSLRTLAFFSVAVLLVVLSVGFVREFRQNSKLRSFDSIRSVRLTSWASLGSSSYSNYSSSHDGKLIVYSSLRNGISEGVFVRQFDGGEEIRITNDDWKNFNPIWSPDDKQIAFVSVRESRAGIYTCPFLGGTSVLLKLVALGNLSIRYWSKDGSSIFYEFDGNLYRLDITSKESSQVTNFPASKTDRYFAVSPDETQVVYVDKVDGQTDLWLMALTGGESHRITNDPETESGEVWHPDGQRIFYTARHDNHYQVNLVYPAGGAPLQVKRGDIQYKIIGISADGLKIFYAIWEDTSDIWGVNTETGEEFTVASELESEFWSDVSYDQRSIIFQQNSTPLPPREMGKSTIVVRALGEKRNQHSFVGTNPKWLPDNRQIAFLRLQEAEQKYDLWLFDTVSGAEKRLTTDGVDAAGFAMLPYNRTQAASSSWSPDAKTFVYLDGKRNNVLMALTDGGETANLTNNDNKDVTFYSPIWSPDGDQIAFVSVSAAEKTVWNVWLFENGCRREIFSTHESLRFLGWSSEGDKLFFETTAGPMKASPTDVKLLEISSGGSSKIVHAFEKISALSMVLSPDGKRLAFVARQDGIDNVFISSAVTGETTQITTNSIPEFCFGSLEWSPDGKAIYFDKQQQIYTISMFDHFN